MAGRSFDVTSGVTLSRTLIPALPPQFLTRAHLFPLLESSAPSTTVVIAPAGYGKTSLVASWAHQRKESVIWVTITNSDSLGDMSALLIQATRNILPDFAPWFVQGQLFRPTEVIRRWGNELLTRGQTFHLVVDNLRDNNSADVDVAVKLIEQFPRNLHLIAIRRDSLESRYGTFLTRGSLQVVGSRDLKFNEEEVKNLSKNLLNDVDDAAVQSSLMGADGWPAAVSMLLQQISKSQKPIDYEKIVASQTDPVRALCSQVFSALEPNLQAILSGLSVIEEFNHQEAEIILGELYDFDLINQISLDGNFFSQTSDPKQTFTFSLLMREVLLAELRKVPERKIEIHQRLLDFYEFMNKPNLSLEHAFLAGNYQKVSEIFPSAARALQATGRGNELVRWSVFAGDNSKIGLLKRATVELTGHLCALEFRTVTSMIEQMRFEARGTELEGFINQFVAGAKAFIDVAYGRFDELDESLKIGMGQVSGPLALDPIDKLGLLRLAAIKESILDETKAVEDIYQSAVELARESTSAIGQYHLATIKALELFQTGDYRRAFDASMIATDQAVTNGFVGIFGPLPSMYVKARCLLEFSRSQEAFEEFNRIRILAEQWKQWTWYFLADGYFARDLALKGQVVDSLDKIKAAREKASDLDNAKELAAVIDLSEIFIRYQIKDNARLLSMLQSAPKTRLVEQIRLSVDGQTGDKNILRKIESLPSDTPREQIWKLVAEADSVIDQEKLAIKALVKALEIGARVGAKETFLRQESGIGNLIIRIAGQNPTVYLEDLASAVSHRIRENQALSEDSNSSLTKRELEVLRHLSTDRPISAIAATLHISQNTMKTHLKNMYRKMGVDGRVTAVEKAKAKFIL